MQLTEVFLDSLSGRFHLQILGAIHPVQLVCTGLPFLKTKIPALFAYFTRNAVLFKSLYDQSTLAGFENQAVDVIFILKDN